jgi:hypothetical protein
MGAQRELHQAAIEHLHALKAIIDKVKTAGPHPLDRWNALMNISERLAALVDRCDLENMTGHRQA